ncbi:unnamed protein product [Cunninghamella echinulata]
MTIEYLYLISLVTILFETVLAAEPYGDFGCWKGRCWSHCAGAGTFLSGVDEWCYTTRGSSQDYNYVYCNSNNDCDNTWHCAGPCTL